MSTWTEGDAALPEVEVGAMQGEAGKMKGSAEEGLAMVREAVVRHVVEGLSSELPRELMEVGM
jgi:hypothetical protein